jgi:hypothetical protein
MLAWVMRDDEAVREAALEEGEAVLQEGPISHNFFWFYRFAMDASIEAEDWARVERYATALEVYTREEPLGWTDFFIARGRAVAAFGRGKRGDETRQALEQLRREAERLTLRTPLLAVEKALSSA